MILSLVVLLLPALMISAAGNAAIGTVNSTEPYLEARIFGGPVSAPFLTDPWASRMPEYARGFQQQKPVLDDDNSVKTAASAKNNYKLVVSCDEEQMKVRVEFEKPFLGVIYSKGYFNKPECVYVDGKNKAANFSFTIDYSKCGSFNRKAMAPAASPAAHSATALAASSSSSTTTPKPVQRTADPHLENKAFDFPGNNLPPMSWTQPTTAVSLEERATTVSWEKAFNDSLRQQAGLSDSTQSYTVPPPALSYGNQAGYGFSPDQYMANQFQPTAFIPGNMQQLQNIVRPYLPGNVQQTNGGVQNPQSYFPTASLGYSAPVQPSFTGQIYPRAQFTGGVYPQSVINAAQFPYNAGGYQSNFGRMGRMMDDDVPAVDFQWVENTIIIQQDSNVQDAMDEAKSLQCEWKEKYNKKLVSHGYRVEMADVVRASFPGDSVGAYMQIRTGQNPTSPEAKGVIKIGSPLALVIGLTDSDNKFDLRIHSCFARGSVMSSSMQLVDENGCAVRDKYMGPFKPFFDSSSSFGNNRIAFAYFQAFKFPDSTEVNIECSVTICRSKCSEQCFGRYRDDSANSINSGSVGKERSGAGRSMNTSQHQQGIMETLARRLSSVNDPHQQFDVKVQAPSPFLANPPKFLQLREMSGDNSTEISTTRKAFLRRIKRAMDNSSNVDLRKKMTVVYPNDIEGMDTLVLDTFDNSAIVPREGSFLPQVFRKLQPPPATGSVATQGITKSPAFYTVNDEDQHVCLPLLIIILGGVLVICLLVGFVTCSLCFCCKVRELQKKDKQSFSPIYSDPRSVAVAAYPVPRKFSKL